MTTPGPLSSSFEALLIASADGEARLVVAGHLLVLDPDDIVSIEVIDAPPGLAVGRARAVRVELRAGAALRALRAAPDV